MTDQAGVTARTLEDPLAEALRIVAAADQRGLLVRLMGGMAVRAHAPEWTHRTRRVEVDLDFATRSKDRAAFYELLEAEGYTPDRQHNALFGRSRRTSSTCRETGPVDVLVDTLEMCHRFDFATGSNTPRRRCPRRAAALEAAGREDQPQGRAGRARPPRRARARRGRRLDGVRRGLRQDQRAAHPRNHLERLGLVADGHREPGQARPVHRHGDDPADLDVGADPVRFDVREQVRALHQAIDEAPKSTRWKMRARVGERVSWYSLPEEVGHGQ